MRSPLLKDLNTRSFFKELPFDITAESNFSVYETENTGFILKPAYLSIYRPLENKRNNLIKRMVDVILSTFLILTVFPWLLPLIAFFIKIDSKGPVFFLQKRNKINGKVFTCIKFRTMVVNDEADRLQASENDRRITRVGKFLRKHYLDELPQLFNVWMGDMSIIGPRPHMISDNKKFEQLVPHYNCRHKVKPGITGLAQVLGHTGPVTDVEKMKKRVEKDIYYVYNWSFVLDTKIACRTIFKIVGLK
ncbi:MAG: sugar transferase [Flavisolibacter sp.]|nr:sugar transferase [Flavisolibacter sp.]MBD0298482.1 sugar transferase [Flavisolibacter sp.]MBD0375208.1 sugar transferase [Flavisolibacter sp.]